MDVNEKPLIEFEHTGKLLRQLPHTLNKLSEDRRHLLRVTVQVAASANANTCV